MAPAIKIIIADDHSLFIDGLVMILSGEPDIAVEDIAMDGKELLNLLAATTVGMVLLDINMPGMNGLDTLRYIKQSWPDTRVIMLSTYNELHLVEKARNNGANGYLLKNCNKQELLQTVRSVFLGALCFPVQKPLKAAPDENDHFLRQFNLSKREIEIVHMIKQGLTNQQMAEQLFLSVYTVETHRKNIMQKLKLRTPAALMKYIVEHGI